MTTAWMAGADAAPPAALIPAPAPAPAAMMAAPIGAPCGGCGSGCGAGCSGAYDECPGTGGRTSLFGKLRAKMGHGGCSSCGGPVYTGFTTASYDDCGCGGKHHGGGLFSRWKGKSSSCGSDCGCDSCGG